MTSSTDRSGVQEAFLRRFSFALDPFQIEAINAISAGESVVVAAPTGSGKTVVAEYAIDVALAEGKRAFYTTPLKALSNQKFHDLVAVHGAQNVGLLTGDNVVNGDAPVVVMTTEVLRNMIYVESPALRSLGFVVLDEVHYLQNAYRGPVWEEVIIHSPPQVSLVCLSATVSNAEELTEWIRTVRGSATPVIEEKRPVALEQHYMVSARGSDRVVMIDTFAANGRANPRGASYDNQQAGRPWRQQSQRPRYVTPGRVEVIEHLDQMDMLPAIQFVFSRNGCDEAVRQCVNANLRLTTPEERQRIRQIAEHHVELLSDDDLRVLEYGSWLHALESGVAAHHAGLVPPFKEVVEACFAEALVKVVFATETLALGINMPARTVVIEKLTKFTGERHEFLSPGEYTQLTGRAGRRGIDPQGHAVVLWSPFTTFEQVASLASTRSYTLTSSFRPTYNMAANLVHRYPADVAHHLLNLSFAQYRADGDVVRLETRLERIDTSIEKLSIAVECEMGDVREWRDKETSRLERRNRDTPEHIAKSVSNLRIGDVFTDPDADDPKPLIVVSTTQRRGHDIRLGVLTANGRKFNLHAKDFTAAVHRVAHVELPKPYNPGNKDFIRRAAMALSNVITPDAHREQPTFSRRGVGACPDIDKHMKALTEVDRLQRERQRLEERVKGRAESLARQFDRVLGMLRKLGYVREWSLTQAGTQLSRLYHESDLLLVECLRQGIFDGLDPASVAALASTFTYESRGPNNSGPEPHFYSRDIEQSWHGILEIWQQVGELELQAALPKTRAPDAGFCGLAYAWVAGDDLAHLLEDAELSGGDFVRNIKQLMDLLRQIGDVAQDPDTARAARVAADQLFRGVVAASSVVS
jgi:ATP-dependent RNA helicase HelY